MGSSAPEPDDESNGNNQEVITVTWNVPASRYV